MACLVCGAESSRGLNRVGGGDVCDPCLHGAAPERIAERGWGFAIKQWQFRPTRESEPVYVTDATLTLAAATPFVFRCRRRTVPWRVVGWFARGLRSGDELFDDHVYVRSRVPLPTLELLRDDGVQSIMLDMLGEGSWIAATGAALRVHSRRSEYIPEARFSSEMCVLASHIERVRAQRF